MTTWKLTIEYDGTRYSGWQEQTNARTVQGELRKAVDDYLGLRTEMQGAGRTDAGVHALAQVAHVRAELKREPTPVQLLRAVNSVLPADIVVLKAERVPNGFHARHDAGTRAYRYQISTRKTAFLKKYVWWIKDELDLGAMARASGMLIGRHDFVCFRALDSARPEESTIVVVESARIDTEDDLIVFRIEASHFLWRMVRRLVGVLARIGTREIKEADLLRLLDGKCEARLDVAAWTAPASGLFLEKVNYPAKKVIARR